MAKVIFSVGVNHPLYNKVVEVNIITKNGGYNGRCIYAETVEEVYYPTDPQGILLFDKNDNLIGYKERKAYSKKWDGWVEKVIEE